MTQTAVTVTIQGHVHHEPVPQSINQVQSSQQANSPQPSSSTGSFKFTSPRDLVKLPGGGRPVKSPQSTWKSRQTKRKGKTDILTSSPYKSELEAAVAEKELRKRIKI